MDKKMKKGLASTNIKLYFIKNICIVSKKLEN